MDSQNVHHPPQRSRRQRESTPPHSGRVVKRARTDEPSGLDLYTKAERVILRAAADALKVSLGRLLELRSSNMATAESDSTGSGGLFHSSSDADQEDEASPSFEGYEDSPCAERRLPTSSTGLDAAPLPLPEPIEVPTQTVQPAATGAMSMTPVTDKVTSGPCSPYVDPWLSNLEPFEFSEMDLGWTGFDGAESNTLPFSQTFGFGFDPSGVGIPGPPVQAQTHSVPGYDTLPQMQGFFERPTFQAQMSLSDVSQNPSTTQTLQVSAYTEQMLSGHGGMLATPPSSKAQSHSSGRKRRGPFKSVEKQAETSLTRKIGACIRCSQQRIRCEADPANVTGTCLTCITAAPHMVWYTPCVRDRLTDAQLLDHDVCPRPTWTSRWKKMEIIDIKTWASRKIKTIIITQDVAGTTYEIKVRKFEPIEGDFLARKWKTKGVEQSFECTPYGIADMAEAGRMLAKFVDETMEKAVLFYVDEADPLLRNTYKMALQCLQTSEVP